MSDEPVETINTPLTSLFGIKHPIMLAGMNVAAGPELAAAVTNAGGMGVIGGVGYTPKFLRLQIKQLKKQLHDKNAPFGVDLLLPQVGGGARKTNTDYTDGKLPELIDIIISEKASLFVSAVGVPPKWVVEKLHSAGIPVMNMIGAPKHVKKCLDAGVDILCAQGGEGGGHTGDVATSILIPAVVDLCKDAVSPLTGGPVIVVAAGGIFDGRGLAMALSLGASGVWVGTRFVCAAEAGAPPRHQQTIVDATVHDTVRTIIFTGRPMRVRKNPYINNWETARRDEIEDLTSRGIVPVMHDLESFSKGGEKKKKGIESASTDADFGLDKDMASATAELRPLLMGQCAGVIKDVLPAAEIIREMVDTAVQILRTNHGRIVATASLAGRRSRL